MIRAFLTALLLAAPAHALDGIEGKDVVILGEVQRYRDAIFAKATLDALETFGAPIVLITGNGHARVDWGVPAMIGAAAPEVSVFSVGFVEAPSEVDDLRFNHTIVTDPVERGDPCDVFKS